MNIQPGITEHCDIIIQYNKGNDFNNIHPKRPSCLRDTEGLLFEAEHVLSRHSVLC